MIGVGGEWGTPPEGPPLCEGQGWHCGMGAGQSEGPEESRLRKLRPHDRSRCAEHGEDVIVLCRACPPTGGSHGRTTRAPILLISIRFPLDFH